MITHDLMILHLAVKAIHLDDDVEAREVPITGLQWQLSNDVHRHMA